MKQHKALHDLEDPSTTFVRSTLEQWEALWASARRESNQLRDQNYTDWLFPMWTYSALEAMERALWPPR